MTVIGSLTSADPKISFKWKIPNFLQIEAKPGNLFESSSFAVWDMNNKPGECKIIIYPKGDETESSGYVSVYLQNDSSYPLTMSYMFSIEDSNGLKQVQRSTVSREFQRSPLDYSSCGFSNFYKVDDLKNNKGSLLPSDSLTITLDIIKPGPVSHASCLIHDHQHIYANRDQFSDMKITCNRKEFSCHRVIISARSPVLRACCENNFKEGVAGVINMDSMDPEIVEVSWILCHFKEFFLLLMISYKVNLNNETFE